MRLRWGRPMADTTYGGLSCAEVAELAPAFVLDALEPDEAARIREHLRGCPEPHPELAELGSVVPALARSVETAQPSVDLGARILAAARADQAERIAAGEVLPVPDALLAEVASDRAGGSARADRAGRRRSFGFLDSLRSPRWAAAGLAAVVIVGVLGAWNLELQGQLADLQAYRDGVTAVLDEASTPGAGVAVLRGGIGASGLAAVDPSGKLVMAMRDLEPTSGTQVYEAWVIGSDGKPLPAGSFSVGSAGIGTLTSSVSGAGPGVVVALTREAGPGATAPTLPILVQGTAGAAG